MFWVNGQPSDTLSLTDRSFQYGDGCFTTILVCAGELQYWDMHVERMESCLRCLAIPVPDWRQVEHWLSTIVPSTAKSGVKIHISRGQGGRGYSPANVGDSQVTISTFEYPAHYIQWIADGIELGVCQQRMGLSPLLAGHKHNNRLEQVLLKSEMDAKGYADGIALDINEHVIETTVANIFWVSEGRLCTPSLDNAGVAGVIRRVLLAAATDLKVEVRAFSLEELLSADEVFITNSLLGVAPVTAIANTIFPIGKITRYFQERFNS